MKGFLWLSTENESNTEEHLSSFRCALDLDLRFSKSETVGLSLVKERKTVSSLNVQYVLSFAQFLECLWDYDYVFETLRHATTAKIPYCFLNTPSILKEFVQGHLLVSDAVTWGDTIAFKIN